MAVIFIGVFLYCLIVLRSIGGEEEAFRAGPSVLLAIAFATMALGALLVFINHMVHSIQASEISDRVAKETLSSIKRLYPESYGEPAEAEDAEEVVRAWQAEREPALVHPERPGFVPTLDHIPDTIGGDSFRVQLLVSPGDFVTEEHPLAAVWSDGDECAAALRRAIAIAAERDLEHDTAYGVRQLADIAVKALSTSVNDPTTATTCIGYLQATLERLAQRPWPWPSAGSTTAT